MLSNKMRESHFYYVKGRHASHPFKAGKVSIIGQFSPIAILLWGCCQMQPRLACGGHYYYLIDTAGDFNLIALGFL